MLTQHFKMLIILKCWISNINANRELEITFGFQHHHPLLRQSWKSPKHARQEAINPRVVFDDLHGRASFCSVQPADLRTSWVEKTRLETQTYGHNTDLSLPKGRPTSARQRPTSDRITQRVVIRLVCQLSHLHNDSLRYAIAQHLLWHSIACRKQKPAWVANSDYSDSTKITPLRKLEVSGNE